MSEASQKNLSFREKLKLFQSQTSNEQPSKIGQNNFNQKNIPEIQDNNIKTDQKNEKQTNLFQEKMKVFQNDSNSIKQSEEQEKSIWVKKLEDKSNAPLNKDEFNNQGAKMHIKQENINDTKNIKNISFQTNETSNSFQERMKIFQPKTNNEQVKTQENIIQTQIKEEKKEEDKSSQTYQTSNSFQEKMKIFQPKTNNEQAKTQENIIQAKIKEEKKEEDKFFQTSQTSNTFQERMKMFQPKTNDEQTKTQENIIQTQVKQEKKEEDKSSQTNQTSNSFQNRMKVFQAETNEVDASSNIKKKKEDNVLIKHPSNSFVEKSRIIGGLFKNTQNDIKSENTDSKIINEPMLKHAKSISQHIQIDFYEEKKVGEKMEYIKKNIMESVTFFDKKYCMVLKNSFILFLKSVILEVLKRNASLSESNLLSKVYLIKVDEMAKQMKELALFVDKTYNEKMHELEVDKKVEEKTNDKNEIEAKAMNYVTSEKESYKEISIQIACDADIDRSIPQDF